MDISYKIKFFNDWHCSSGQASGADKDLLAIKDDNGLPFIPGKTIKGLLRESVETLHSLDKSYGISDEDLANAFGNSTDADYNFFSSKGKAEMIKGTMFFTNAELPKCIGENIISEKLQYFLYRSVNSTAIENGVAKEHSLRKIETVVPCELEGVIIDVPDNLEKIITDGLRFIKRIGLNRNRGLGRCDIKI